MAQPNNYGFDDDLDQRTFNKLLFELDPELWGDQQSERNRQNEKNIF